MKIMFYGGCHAAVLKRVFNRYAIGDHTFSEVRNFELIKAGRSFPFDLLAQQDAIVFSPVRRAEYSTEVILNFCNSHGIKAVSYPWMQWQALYPFSKKGPFLGGTSWRYAEIFKDINTEGVDRAAERTTGFELDDIFHANFSASHDKLVEFEKGFGTDIVVSDFILANYKTTRLFLTPDHPTQALYCKLVKEVSSRIGIEISPDFYYSGVEPQRGVKLPLIPRVSDLFDLSYRDSDFENRTAFGATVLNWREYLKLYTQPEAKVLECQNVTQLKRRPVHSDDLGSAEKLVCPKNTFLVATPVKQAGGYMEVEPLLLAPEGRRVAMPDGRWFIYSKHWTENQPGLM